MKKQKAGERKRTVTITVGPLTEEWAAELYKEMSKSGKCLPASLTDLAGIGLEMALVSWCQSWPTPKPSGWESHWN
jgi:hypothetical protein